MVAVLRMHAYTIYVYQVGVRWWTRRVRASVVMRCVQTQRTSERAHIVMMLI